ncbi:MAG: restriction endonuclease [Clostridia bacterium]|nr:restriction endonuclease [Clostridia bacterium]
MKLSNILYWTVPYTSLLTPTFLALKDLGGSGSNSEILDKVISNLEIPADVADIPHPGNENMSEVAYQLAWARTYLKKYGVITNSERSIWSIMPDYAAAEKLEDKKIIRHLNDQKRKKKISNVDPANPELPQDNDPSNDDVEYPDEAKPWRARLSEILQTMDPFGFERLTQRVLRECGFTQVEVTKKAGDGGIDGTGKLKINGIFSFNVAFQCKRYKGAVGAPEVRDFRGSLTTDIEKGVLITTGTFSKAARDEASNPGKQQIDLIDGEEFINKIVEYGIGVREVKAYEIDEEFFQKI